MPVLYEEIADRACASRAPAYSAASSKPQPLYDLAERAGPSKPLQPLYEKGSVNDAGSGLHAIYETASTSGVAAESPPLYEVASSARDMRPVHGVAEVYDNVGCDVREALYDMASSDLRSRPSDPFLRDGASTYDNVVVGAGNRLVLAESGARALYSTMSATRRLFPSMSAGHVAERFSRLCKRPGYYFVYAGENSNAQHFIRYRDQASCDHTLTIQEVSPGKYACGRSGECSSIGEVVTRLRATGIPLIIALESLGDMDA
jgi:hypothetical protein